MPKRVPLVRIDAMLQLVEGDQLHLCTAEPTTFLEATTTFNLATFTVIGGNYVLANGDVSGRKNTLAALSGASITSTGTSTHAALTTIAGSVLERVTTTNSQLLTSGGTVDTSAHDHEIQQAA